MQFMYTKKRYQGQNSFVLFHKIYKEKVIKRDIVKLQMQKNKFNCRRKWIENYDNKILVRIQFVFEAYVYKTRL